MHISKNIFVRGVLALFVLLLAACGGGGGGTSDTHITLSSDANLSDLSISTGLLAPSFNAATLNYTANVINSVASVTVTPTAAGSNSTIKVNNVAVSSGSASTAIALAVGTNPISVEVTAQDGTTVKTYTVTVTRQAPLSADATLSGLTVSAGSLSPAFSSNTLAYTDHVPMASASIDVTATATSANATMTVNNASVASGASKTVAVPVGQSAISIVVTAQDGVTTKTYSIAVSRPGITLTPANSDISGLNTATLTVTLAASSVADTSVALSSSNTAAVTVPSTVTVVAASTQATFSATSVAAAAASATITATLGADAPTATVHVTGFCTLPSDCGTNTECTTFTCSSGACGVVNAAAGTLVSTQTAGDCHQNQCDSSGNIVSAIDNTDVPVDGNICTSDICTLGVPSNPNANGTPCSLANSNASCSYGACSISSCLTGFYDCDAMTADGCEHLGPCTCSDGMKNGNETDVDCGGSCNACTAGKTCAANSDCLSGTCNPSSHTCN